jgi:hypothetical protein
MDNFTITGGDGIVATTFENNTLTITPMKIGEVTITLTKAEDDSYYAINQTYHIKVLGASALLTPDESPALEYNEYAEITLNRSFAEGHSTLTLPFDTDISHLSNHPNAYAAQLSLVTYNKADGYTLYFQKVADGLMLANQPYVVYLPESISNPEWTDITVGRPEAGSVSSASTQGWSMHANYTPNFPMEGKYGLAGGLFRKGTEGSYLNAYTAYFVPPVATEARIRMAMLKDDGSATYIDSIEPGQTSSDECEIFGLDGIRLGSMKQGVNIVRMKDGSVRKVMKR